MNEEMCVGGMIDKVYAASLNHVIVLRNHNIMATDTCQGLTSCNSSKVINKRRRWYCCTGGTDRKFSVPVQASIQNDTEHMRRYQRRVKRKEAGGTSSKLRNGKLGLGLETKNRVKKGTPEAEGKHQGKKQVKKSINATDNGSQGQTIDAINGCTGKGNFNGSGKEDGKVDLMSTSLNASVPCHSRKKLLVLDLNGLLVDIRQENNVGKKSDFRVNGKPAFKRPYCDDFLRFCFENFKIGIWSSRKRQYINKVVDILMSNLKHEILFCWDQSMCTATGHRALENVHKQLCFKDLRKIWEKTEPNLPFEKGEYFPANTLLIDDSPYKAFCNPPNTAIFPVPYTLENAEDNSLGPGGKLRCYLEGLVQADDVQCYVREHPFGQPAISDGHHLWGFYSKILEGLEREEELAPF